MFSLDMGLSRKKPNYWPISVQIHNINMWRNLKNHTFEWIESRPIFCMSLYNKSNPITGRDRGFWSWKTRKKKFNLREKTKIWEFISLPVNSTKASIFQIKKLCQFDIIPQTDELPVSHVLSNFIKINYLSKKIRKLKNNDWFLYPFWVVLKKTFPEGIFS